ncbi:hypothetical protein [Phenylobacterium sp.]|uniref:hypothetical protein n=1 Tax=Phenylobacterium sp. TaxID=1871053 RepID=UPI0030F419D7
MSWLMRTVLGLALAFSASAALAGCPGPCAGGYDDGNRGGQSSYSGGYSLRTYGDVAQHYGYPSCGQCAAFAHERAYEARYDERYDERGPAPCRAQGCGDCRQCGELILGGNFTYDYGVGPYPEGGYGGGGGGGYAMGGGGGYAGAGSAASASARASASASSSSHISINVGGRGGHKGGGHKGGGGCNTCGGGHKGGGHK